MVEVEQNNNQEKESYENTLKKVETEIAELNDDNVDNDKIELDWLLTQWFAKYLWVEKAKIMLDSINKMEKKPEWLQQLEDFLKSASLSLNQWIGENERQQENLIKWPDKYVYWYNLTENHLNKISNTFKKLNSPLEPQMIKDSCLNFPYLPAEYLLWFMQNDSRLWTDWNRAIKNHNPWNVWNTDDWKNTYFETWADWVNACAENLNIRIDAYFKAKKEHNWKWFNDFPTPKELATWKARGWSKFFKIYMTNPNWPSTVEWIVNHRNKKFRT